MIKGEAKARERDTIERIIDHLEDSIDHIEEIRVEKITRGIEEDTTFKVEMETKLVEPEVAEDPETGWHYEVT